MSFAGDLWSSVNRVASQAKLNLKTILVGTGDEILSKAPGSLTTGQIASVTADSSGGSLRAGDIVQWNGSAWAAPDAVTTSFRDTMIGAIQNTWFASFPAVTEGLFYKSGTGGTYVDTISGTDAYILASTSTTTSSAANLRYGGYVYSFTYPSMFETRIQLSNTTTSTVARCGMNMEPVDITTDNKAKYGIEGCTGCNETSISVISSEGTLRSKNTDSSDNYALLGNYAMKLDPNVSVKYRKESGAIISKATNVPYTGVSDRSNSWMCGVQTGTTAARTLKLYAFSAVAQLGDTIPTI